MSKSIEGLVGQLNKRLAVRLWLLGLCGAVFEHASILERLRGQGNRFVLADQDVLLVLFGMLLEDFTERIIGRESGQVDYFLKMFRINTYMVYVDMDGVLANLYDYLSGRIFGKSFVTLSPLKRDTLKAVWKNRKGFDLLFPEGPERMFENLKPYPFNEILIRTIVKHAGEYTILSRPSNLDLEGTSRAKIKWIEQHLLFSPPKEVLLVREKTSNGRAPGNILIDDFDPFLEKWKACNGIAVEFKAWTYNSSKQVETYITKQFLNN